MSRVTYLQQSEICWLVSERVGIQYSGGFVVDTLVQMCIRSFSQSFKGSVRQFGSVLLTHM